MLRTRLVIGRTFGSELWIDDPRLSRKHCVIERVENEWVVGDLQSTNGTYVNSKLIDRKVLTEGDSIEIGRVRIEYREGSFVEYRPSDPIEAASAGMGRIPLEPTDPSTATVVGEPIFRRPLPLPQPDVVFPQPLEMPAVPLPFTRPPAKPIPHGQPPITPSRSHRWVGGMISHLWGD